LWDGLTRNCVDNCVASLYISKFSFRIFIDKITWRRWFLSSLKIFINSTPFVVSRVILRAKGTVCRKFTWVGAHRWEVTQAAADTSRLIASICFCMTILLAIITLTNWFCFVRFFNFDFRVQYWGEMKNVWRIGCGFQIHKK
jgi:hypothetical protein